VPPPPPLSRQEQWPQRGQFALTGVGEQDGRPDSVGEWAPGAGLASIFYREWGRGWRSGREGRKGGSGASPIQRLVVMVVT